MERRRMQSSQFLFDGSHGHKKDRRYGTHTACRVIDE
jgi:hypothetical protein